ncbi:MAG: efflux RND transporter periplasmic adaptor subunit [Pseudomonadota bacterium]
MTRKTDKPSLIRRIARAILRTTVTLAVIAGAAFAVQFGASELTQRANAAPAPDAAPAIPVAATPIRRETGYDIARSFIGQVEPQKTVTLSFELPGQLAEIAADEGDRIMAGDLVAAQDTSLLEAERRQLGASRTALAAQLLFAEQTVTRNSELNDRGFASQAALDGAIAARDELQARIAEIDAGLANVDIRLRKAQLLAPFDGRVTTRLVDGGEALGAGQPVLELVEDRAPFVRVGVPLDLDASVLAEAQIDIAGQTHLATLVTLRPDVDPVTRTRTALFRIDADTQPAFGQTARLLVTERVAADGIWVPLTALKEGVRGQWTLLTVDPEEIVRAATVEVLHARTDAVFVRGGFPEGTMLIDDGPQRVTVGQRVIAQGS